MIGRNGKGKTTFLKLLRGEYPYKGSISTSALFDYFPYEITQEQLQLPAADFMDHLKSWCELWRVICELNLLGEGADILYRPFGQMSPGERTKILLAVLFSGEQDFLLIDEPTNHLDQQSREKIKEYLAQKKGFILVSHYRDLLDACVDHVLVLNRQTIEVQRGNFSSWWGNKERRDRFEQAENEKHQKEIAGLKAAAARSENWAVKMKKQKLVLIPPRSMTGLSARGRILGPKRKKCRAE